MEIWTSNIAEIYHDALDSGDVTELGVNFDGNTQRLICSTFVIKGDAARGIEPMAPGLKTVKDLAEYWQVFRMKRIAVREEYGSPLRMGS